MDCQPSLSVVRRDLAPGGRNTRSGPRLASSLLAAAVHIVAIGAACLIILPGALPPPTELAIPVMFEAPSSGPEPSMPAQTLPMVTLRAPTMATAAKLAAVPPLALQADPQARAPHPAPHHIWLGHTQNAASRALSPVAALVQPSIPASATAATNAPPAVPSGPMLQGLAAWEARVRQAIQHGLIYPAAARLMHREGRTQIRFDYDHGAVENVAVAEPSIMAPLDRAAMQAVTRAALPAPPAEIAGRRRTMLVWVNFTLESVD